MCVHALYECQCLLSVFTNIHAEAAASRLESAGLSGRFREMEARSLGSQAQVGRP